MANPTGESNGEVLRLDFDRRLTLQFRGSVLTSDAGLLAYRELDDALGLSAMAGERLADAGAAENGGRAVVGMLRSGTLRAPGNAHSTDGWERVLKPVVARCRGKVLRIYFRADAGFANPKLYEYLQGEEIKYAIRLPANRVLQERIGYLLKRPVGHPSLDARRSYASFTH
jgi:hypothetical protein